MIFRYKHIDKHCIIIYISSLLSQELSHFCHLPFHWHQVGIVSSSLSSLSLLSPRAQSTLLSIFPWTPSDAMFKYIFTFVSPYRHQVVQYLNFYLYLCLTVYVSDFKLQWLKWSEHLVPDAEAKARPRGEFWNHFNKWPLISSNIYNIFTL